MTEGISNPCPWCERPFRPRRGGSPQRFCQSKCRVAFWSALRRWGERAIDLGILTIGDIKNGAPTACTLLQGPSSPAPPEYPSSTAPHSSSRYSQEDFERLLAATIAARRR